MSQEYLSDLRTTIESVLCFDEKQKNAIDSALIDWQRVVDSDNTTSYETHCGRFILSAKQVMALAETKIGDETRIQELPHVEFSCLLSPIHDKEAGVFVYKPEDFPHMVRMLKIIGDQEFWPYEFSSAVNYVTGIPNHIANVFNKREYYT